MIAGKALTFDVVFSAPTQALKAELVWDSEEDSLRIVSVPEKIIALDSLSYTLKRVITVFDGTWSLDLLIQAQGKKSFIQIPVEILPAPAP